MTIRRDPFETMDRMFEQMRRAAMFPPAEDAEAWDAETPLALAGGSFGGDANLRTERTGDGYRVMADLPGFEKEDITVRFEDGLLTIAAEHEATGEGETAYRNRRVFDQLRIPGTAVENEIEASYRNGVLEVTVPTEGEVDDDHVIDVE